MTNGRKTCGGCLTTKPVNTIDDLKCLKIRILANQILLKGFEVLGVTQLPMRAVSRTLKAARTIADLAGAGNPVFRSGCPLKIEVL